MGDGQGCPPLYNAPASDNQNHSPGPSESPSFPSGPPSFSFFFPLLQTEQRRSRRRRRREALRKYADMDIERAAAPASPPLQPRVPQTDLEVDGGKPTERSIKWWLVAINVACMAVGTIGGPLLVRVYFLHGGSRKWLSSWLQTAGFPILLGPIGILYFRSRERVGAFVAEPRLLAASAAIGLLIGLDNFMYSHGLSSLPVSTSSLLFATQLVFTALFALVIVRQRFTAFSINAVVLMTMGSVLLGLSKSGDRPAGTTNAEYLLGFFITLGTAALLGFLLPCIELAYAKATRAINYAVVMQFQLGVTFFATVFCTIGMIANKDFQAIGREASSFDIGETKYYVVLVSIAVMFQLVYIGSLGLVFCSSSLFTGIVTATLLPLTEVAAVIFFKEKFTGVKGMSLALCVWGFASYFYGAYRQENKEKRDLAKQTEE